MHILDNVINWTVGLKPGLPQVVVSNQGSYLETCAQINPESFRVYRYVNDAMQIFSDTWEGSKELARRWFAAFVDGTFMEHHAQYVNAVKGYNETLSVNSQTPEEIHQRWLMEKALAVVWNEEYRAKYEVLSDVKVVLLSTAVGNDIPESFAALGPEFDALISYHAYMYFQNKIRPDWEKDNLSGRWMIMDEDYDVKPTWIFTEGGPFESAVTGWRADACLDGDVNMYVDAMRQQFREIKQSAAWQEGRVMGPPVWFTTGGSDTWKEFFTNASELELLSQMLVDEWETPTPPMPIPLDHAIKIWEKGVEEQVIRLLPTAALQQAIYEAGMQIVSNEYELTLDGIRYVCQRAESFTGGPAKTFAWLNGEIIDVEIGKVAELG